MAAAWIQRALRFFLGRGCLSAWTDIGIDSGEALQNSRNELLYQPARGPAAERCGEPIVARCHLRLAFERSWVTGHQSFPRDQTDLFGSDRRSAGAFDQTSTREMTHDEGTLRRRQR